MLIPRAEEMKSATPSSLEEILGENRKDALDLLKYYFDHEKMSGEIYKLMMSSAKKVRDFVVRISKLKLT